MATNETPSDHFEAVMASLRKQGVKPTSDAYSALLPPIMADPSQVFEPRGDQGPTISLLTRLRGISNPRNVPQIAQDGPIDSPGPKDAAE